VYRGGDLCVVVSDYMSRTVQKSIGAVPNPSEPSIADLVGMKKEIVELMEGENKHQAVGSVDLDKKSRRFGEVAWLRALMCSRGAGHAKNTQKCGVYANTSARRDGCCMLRSWASYAGQCAGAVCWCEGGRYYMIRRS
jgi:hypothetical protein